MERCPEIVRLGDYRILCSSSCQRKHDDQGDDESPHAERIRLLEKELLEKKNHIKRLKRNSQAFEDAALDSETKLTSQLDLLTNSNASLVSEIKELKRNESLLNTEIAGWKDTKNKLDKNIRELTDLNKNLLTTVSTLEQENVVYSNDVKGLRQELDVLRYTNDKRDCGIQTSPTVCATQPGRHHSSATEWTIGIKDPVKTLEITPASGSYTVKRHQTLIIGDENVRGFGNLVKQYSKKKFDVNCQWQKRITLLEITKLCSLFSKSFTKNDYIIAFLGSENAIKGLTLRDDDVKNLLNSCRHTNLILIGPPLYTDRPVLNRIIEEQNSLILNNLDKFNEDVYFLPLLCHTSYGYLNYFDKSSLVNHVCARLQTVSVRSDGKVDVSATNVSAADQCSEVVNSNF